MPFFNRKEWWKKEGEKEMGTEGSRQEGIQINTNSIPKLIQTALQFSYNLIKILSFTKIVEQNDPKMEISTSKKKFCLSLSWFPPPYVHLSRSSLALSGGRCLGIIQLLCSTQISYMVADTSWYRTQSQVLLVFEGIILNTILSLLLHSQRNWSTWMCSLNTTKLAQQIDSATSGITRQKQFSDQWCLGNSLLYNLLLAC